VPDFAFGTPIGYQLATNCPGLRRIPTLDRRDPGVVEHVDGALVQAREPARIPAERCRRIGVTELRTHVRDRRAVRE
jgi:hypothetical protein